MEDAQPPAPKPQPRSPPPRPPHGSNIGIDFGDDDEHPKPSLEFTRQEAFIVTTRLPGVQSGDIEIVAQRSKVRVVGKLTGSRIPFDGVIEVPAGYEVAGAKATYHGAQLQIVFPKRAALAAGPKRILSFWARLRRLFRRSALCGSGNG